jgi:hypothetical protein
VSVTFKITAGVLSSQDAAMQIAGCYSGGDHGLRPEAVNNPAMCNVRPNVGPLPIGQYTIEPLAFQQAVHSMGFFLRPDPANEMFGGSDFYIHWNNPHRDAGQAPYAPIIGRNSSDGCVCILVVNYSAMIEIERRRAAGDNQLTAQG